MSFVLSVTRPPANGTAFGKATVLDPVHTFDAVRRCILYILRSEHGVSPSMADDFATILLREPTGTSRAHMGTGLVFRMDYVTDAPHPCPCCTRLVLPTDHEQAGLEDAYCLGCFTWDRNVPACLPANSAHANPWTNDTRDARWHLEIVFETEDGDTSSDDRYSSSVEQPDEDIAAEIVWPGIHPDDIISLTITPITESED